MTIPITNELLINIHMKCISTVNYAYIQLYYHHIFDSIDVDECNDGTFSNCMGARDVSCTRGEACGANMDCSNFPGGYNCTCSDGFVTDPQDSSSCVCK